MAQFSLARSAYGTWRNGGPPHITWEPSSVSVWAEEHGKGIHGRPCQSNDCRKVWLPRRKFGLRQCNTSQTTPSARHILQYKIPGEKKGNFEKTSAEIARKHRRPERLHFCERFARSSSSLANSEPPIASRVEKFVRKTECSSSDLWTLIKSFWGNPKHLSVSPVSCTPICIVKVLCCSISRKKVYLFFVLCKGRWRTELYTRLSNWRKNCDEPGATMQHSTTGKVEIALAQVTSLNIAHGNGSGILFVRKIFSSRFRQRTELDGIHYSHMPFPLIYFHCAITLSETHDLSPDFIQVPSQSHRKTY